jgi:hypothetical protein
MEIRWTDPDLYAKRCSAHQGISFAAVIDADWRKAAPEGQWLSARQLPPTNWKVWIGIVGEHNGWAIGSTYRSPLGEYVSYAIHGSTAWSSAQTRTFFVGLLYIYAFSCASMPELVDRIELL